MNSPPAPVPPQGHHLLEGKTVLVTAAAGTGIGFATARRCAEEGATVLLSDQHERRLESCAAMLAEEMGQTAAPFACDVTDGSQVEALVEHAIAELGHIDVLVNNAGLGGTTNVVDMSDAQWDRVLDVTLGGTFRCVRAALRHMLPRGQGSIVNVGSALAWRAQAGQSHYAAAKAGVLALTRCAAMEAAPSGVRVNAVVPSLVLHPNLAKVSSPEFLESLIQKEAMKRSAEPWEVSNVIIFLASDLASYLTGEAISVSEQRA
ncbi:MAG: short chain dehydrogenase [Deltaproteobacteria bacterium]|nr:short chain dehydrogenase [Deltaproteobacteria bacterium]